MWDDGPKTRHWVLPMLFCILLGALMGSYSPVLTDWMAVVGWGSTAVFGLWSLFNLGHQALAIWGGEYAHIVAARYRLSANALAEQIGQMDRWQLETLRMFGSQVVQVLVSEGDEPPVQIIYGTQVSLAFAEYFLSRSNDRSCCPISHFADQTYHWDWTGENRIQDRDQARELTAWLVRMEMAKWWSGNQAAAWLEGERGHRWSPEKVMRRLGIVVMEDVGGEQ